MFSKVGGDALVFRVQNRQTNTLLLSRTVPLCGIWEHIRSMKHPLYKAYVCMFMPGDPQVESMASMHVLHTSGSGDPLARLHVHTSRDPQQVGMVVAGRHVHLPQVAGSPLRRRRSS